MARRYEVHRRLVREALSSAWPEPRKKLPPRKSRLDPGAGPCRERLGQLVRLAVAEREPLQAGNLVAQLAELAPV